MTKFISGNILLCPACECEYLHNTSVHIENNDTFLDFWCEDCGEGHSRILEISNRKGHTMFRWIFDN